MMTFERPLLAVLCTTVIAMALVVLLDWPWWLITAFAVVGAVAGGVVHSSRRYRREQRLLMAEMGAVRERHVEDPASSVSGCFEISDVPVPSAENEFDFLVSAAVHWTAPEQHPGDVEVVVRGQVLSAIYQFTTHQSPDNPRMVEASLAGVPRMLGDRLAGGVAYWLEGLRLRLSDEDATHLRQIRDLRRRQRLWEAERDFEVDRMTHLARHPMSSRANAVLWSLAHEPERVTETVRLLDDLSLLVDTVVGGGGGPVGHPPIPPWAELADLMFPDDEEQRAMFGAVLGERVARFGHQDLAIQILESFGLTDTQWSDFEVIVSPSPEHRGESASTSGI